MAFGSMAMGQGFDGGGLPGLHLVNGEKEMGHACGGKCVMRNVATVGRVGRLRMVATVDLSGPIANACGHDFLA
ncbi:MAG: hypothetical protein IPG76_04135 [Acidobacteria bacterium]|nr:hypothetical protein [Acidobacteriota bacterium]